MATTTRNEAGAALDPTPVLLAYRDVMSAADALRWGRCTGSHFARRDVGGAGFPELLGWRPVSRRLVRRMVLQHIHARAAELHRGYSRLLAVSRAPEERHSLEGYQNWVSEFQDSLGERVGVKRAAIAVAVFVLVGAALLADVLPPPMRKVVTAQYAAIADALEHVGFRSVVTLLESVRTGGVDLLVVGLLLLLPFLASAAIVLLSAFRMKRILLNLHPDPGAAKRRWTVPSSHRWRAEGVYAEEARLLAALALPVTHEFPWDLLARLVVALAGLAFFASALADELSGNVPPGLQAKWFYVGVLGWLGSRLIDTTLACRSRRRPAAVPPIVTRAWLVGGDAAGGQLRLEGDELSFLTSSGEPVFSLVPSDVRAVRLTSWQSFGKGLVLVRRSTAAKYTVTFQPPPVARIENLALWCGFAVLGAWIVAPPLQVGLSPGHFVVGLGMTLGCGAGALSRLFKMAEHLEPVRPGWQAARLWKPRLVRWP